MTNFAKSLAMRFIHLLMCCLLSVIISCSSARKSYQKGNYESAIRKSAKEIKAEKDVKQNTALLNNAFDNRFKELAYEFEDRKRSNFDKQKKLYKEMAGFAELATEARPFLNQENITNKSLNESNLLKIEDEVCAVLYERGMQHLDNARAYNDKKEARMAHERFKDLASFDKGGKYKETRNLINLALDLATYRYQFNIDHGFNIGYSWKIRNRFSNLASRGSTYKLFYVDASCKPCDCIIGLLFRDLRESEETTRETKNFEKKVEDGFTTTKDDRGNTINIPRFKTLRGQVEIKKTTLSFNWQIQANVRKGTPACDVNFQSFEINRKFEYFDYYITGDREAVPSEYKSYVKPVHKKDSILDEMLENLYYQVYSYYD